MIRKHIGTAKFEQYGSDLFWKYYVMCGNGGEVIMSRECQNADTCKTKPVYGCNEIRWIGYNDAKWLANAMLAPSQRIRSIPCGRIFEIDYTTNEVYELLQPRLNEASDEELKAELEKRNDVVEEART